MAKNSGINKVDLTDRLYEGFMKARKKLIEEAKKRNGYLIISQDGKVVKVPAKDL